MPPADNPVSCSTSSCKSPCNIPMVDQENDDLFGWARERNKAAMYSFWFVFFSFGLFKSSVRSVHAKLAVLCLEDCCSFAKHAVSLFFTTLRHLQKNSKVVCEFWTSEDERKDICRLLLTCLGLGGCHLCCYSPILCVKLQVWEWQ